jgi:hypothetical protein
MLKSHDLTKLEARGFQLREHFVGEHIDGISANLQLSDALSIQIYQGCQEVYELRGQGRGRPKKHVLVDEEWFKPSWTVCQQDNGKWADIASGGADSVDTAVMDALNRCRELFAGVEIPAGVAR